MSSKSQQVQIPKNLAVKICGMKETENILDIAALNPEYLGFIFAKKSPRYFEGVIPALPDAIQKVGVFVDETVEVIVKLVNLHQLQAVQLHGKESVEFCERLKQQLSSDVKVIKVFSVGAAFDFKILEPFEKVSDYFLLDTKGKFPGGNGTQFDWKILEKYTSQKPFFLSGGIGVDDTAAVQQLRKMNLPLHAIDCNSKLEISAGMKNKKQCEELIENFAFKNEH
ncbi:phosphoribosylanthranilate isomerase [Flavobacterium tegetincola]|uniref:phosphoribosylanthranilate isomerase n=1 Tax=Flavobacterium tegetincola TaxID=150172 RepID=UPI000417285E|nr:phosphoribosylanthranilate isomerase [Flavobacterium tegetincola]